MDNGQKCVGVGFGFIGVGVGFGCWLHAEWKRLRRGGYPDIGSILARYWNDSKLKTEIYR